MVNLSAGIGLAPQKQKGQHTDGLTHVGVRSLYPLPKVAGLPWNQWPLSSGMGGRFAMESAAGFTWNTQ
jgi:hypothetical protein